MCNVKESACRSAAVFRFYFLWFCTVMYIINVLRRTKVAGSRVICTVIAGEINALVLYPVRRHQSHVLYAHNIMSCLYNTRCLYIIYLYIYVLLFLCTTRNCSVQITQNPRCGHQWRTTFLKANWGAQLRVDFQLFHGHTPNFVHDGRRDVYTTCMTPILLYSNNKHPEVRSPRINLPQTCCWDAK